MKNKIEGIPTIFWILVFGFLIRVILSFFGTLRLDQGTFIAWSVNLASGGLKNFYSGWSDYLPGYMYILWGLGKVRGFIPDTLLYKLPAILSDLATAFLISKIVGGKKGLWGSVIYLFNPAIFANSALWGQVDSFTALFSMLALYLFPAKYLLSAIFLALGTLLKPQAAFVFPVVVYLFIKHKFDARKIISYLGIGLLVFVAGFVPFWNQGNFFEFFISRLALSANQYPYTSVNAFNFWGLFGQWKPDNVYFQVGGYVVFLISSLAFYLRSPKQKNFKYLFTSFIFAFSFLFFTRMHERHLLPVFAPLTVVAATQSVFIIPLIGLSLAYVLNLLYSFNWVSFDFKILFEPFPVIILALLSFGLFIFSSFNYQKIKKIIESFTKSINKGRHFLPDSFPRLKSSSKLLKVSLVLILILSFGLRVYRLGEPPKDYFDEIYHAFTARLVLHSDPKAWEWWNPHPEGFAYEWTHPPLSKIIMAGGMKILGENAFGWRIPQAIFGTFSIFLVYLLTKKIFKDELLGVIAAGVFSLDGLSLVLSRMGMNDIYVLTFMLLSVYFFLDKKDVLSAISLGLAISSKWSAFWTIPILFILWLRREKKFSLVTILSFLILPVGVYLLTYTQMFTTGHGLDIWWGMQQQMWWYHTGLHATHPYTSAWWSWPLMARGVYLYTSEEVGGVVSRIYAIGNPFVFWSGLAFVILALLRSFFEKNKQLGLIVFSYLIFFVPWAASPRIMFLYHYLPSIPFMCIAIAYFLRKYPAMLISYATFATLLFIYFYPHWAGLPVPLWLDKSYYWIASWR